MFKLCQTGTLKDYIAKFSQLANRTSDTGLILLKSCFLRGLKRELKYDVKLLKPVIVHNAISISVYLESKHTELKFPQYKVSIINKPQLIVAAPPSYTVPCPGNLAIEKLSPKGRGKKVMVL